LINFVPVFVSVAAAFGATLSAGILARKMQKNMGIVCAFAAGFFIALPLFDLLPDILSVLPQVQVAFYLPLGTAIAGFFFLFGVYHVTPSVHSKNHESDHQTTRPKVGLFSTIEFCAHGFLEGLAIGLSFGINFALGVLVAFAVISHDFCDGMSTLTLMLNSGNSLKSSLGMLFVDAFAPVLGALASFLFVYGSAFVVYALAFLIGSFLYIGAGSLLPDAYHMTGRKVTAGFFLLGFGIILVISRILAG